MPNIIQTFLQQATAQGSRSTVLKPLGWMIAICISATLSSAYFGLQISITYMFAIFCGLTMLLYLAAYIYCLLNDRDALRSETYNFQKMAIEKGFVGDSLTGIFYGDESISTKAISSIAEGIAKDDKCKSVMLLFLTQEVQNRMSHLQASLNQKVLVGGIG